MTDAAAGLRIGPAPPPPRDPTQRERPPAAGERRVTNEFEMLGITKRFPGVLANNGIDLAVRAGEIRP